MPSESIGMAGFVAGIAMPSCVVILCGKIILGSWAFLSKRGLQNLELKLTGQLMQDEATHRAAAGRSR